MSSRVLTGGGRGAHGVPPVETGTAWGEGICRLRWLGSLPRPAAFAASRAAPTTPGSRRSENSRWSTASAWRRERSPSASTRRGDGPTVRADDPLDRGDQRPGLGRRVAGGGRPDMRGRDVVAQAQDDVVPGGPGARDLEARGQVADGEGGPVEPIALRRSGRAQGSEDPRSSRPPRHRRGAASSRGARARRRTSRPGPGARGRRRQDAGQGPRDDVCGARGVEQLVGPDGADADGGDGMVVAGDGQGGAVQRRRQVPAAEGSGRGSGGGRTGAAGSPDAAASAPRSTAGPSPGRRDRCGRRARAHGRAVRRGGARSTRARSASDAQG